MPYHPAVHFRDQRYRKTLGGTQRFDDALFRVIADFQGLEGCESDLRYRGNIVLSLVPDNDLWIHVLICLRPAGLRGDNPPGQGMNNAEFQEGEQDALKIRYGHFYFLI